MEFQDEFKLSLRYVEKILRQKVNIVLILKTNKMCHLILVRIRTK